MLNLTRKFGQYYFSSVNTSHIKNVSVIGGGQMGTGIAYVASKIGKIDTVQIIDLNEQTLTHSQKFIEGLLNKEIKKSKITEQDKADVLSRIVFSSSLQDAKDTNFVIEAVNEDLTLKKKIFQELDNITDPDTILATNTSSLSITKIAAFTKRPDKVIGMHFMNPVPVMEGVELIKALQTSQETQDITSL